MSGTPLLALNDDDRARAGKLLVELLDGYERALPTAHLVPDVDRAALTELLTAPIPDKGIGVDGLFSELTGTLLPNSTTVAHPRFLAYVQGPPNGIAPYVEAVAAAINQNCNFWQLSPAASVIERAVVNWMGKIVGYSGEPGGILTGGGSIATLNALCTALTDRCPDFRSGGLQRVSAPLVVYTSEQAHRSVDKAAVILGLGLDHVRHIPTDADYRMRPDALAEAIAADRRAGRQPFCVVATAGTVTTGSIDPLDTIADMCQDEDLWLHVDGAYGALFMLSADARPLFSGCDRADSVTLDPHKLLFAPLEAGCVLVRDREKLRNAFAFSSSYLTAEDDPLMTNYMDYGPQLSRGFKALKVWSALRMFGVETFRAVVQQTLDLAQYLAQRIDTSPDLELMAPVPLSAVCFRIRHATDHDHAAILSTLAADGTALLGPAVLGDHRGMRACVTNFRTTRDDIDLIIDRISRLARTLGNSRTTTTLSPTAHHATA